MIFKMQRALQPKDSSVLIYDQHRKYQSTLPITPILKGFFKEAEKIYIEGKIDNQGRLVIYKKVPDQPW